MTRSSIIKKTLAVGSSTLLSRALGFVRDLLLIRYLGASAASDAFLTAFRVPNSLRKIFAEGALSAALIPTLVKVVRERGIVAASRLMTGIFIIVGTAILVLCCAVVGWATPLIHLIAPGFSAEQTQLAAPLLKILIFFIFFIFGSALCAAALQAVHHFFIPSFGQVVLNAATIAGIAIALYYQLPVVALAWSLVIGAAIVFALHVGAYLAQRFMFVRQDLATRAEMKEVFRKFLPCLLSVGMIEINLFIDAQFASYLPIGSISLLSYASSFMRIPLGVLVVAFANILLPHLARVSQYAPRRLSYYLFESIKLIVWAIVPIIIIMSSCAYDIFYTLYYSPQFSLTHVVIAQRLLIILLVGLLFFSLNKILLNFFYALHETVMPTTITLAGTVINTVLNYLLMGPLGVYGLALATTIAAAVQTVLLVLVLKKKFGFILYGRDLGIFLGRAVGQLSIILLLWYGFLYSVKYLLVRVPSGMGSWLLGTWGLWLWVSPLVGLACLAFWYTRRLWGIKIHFLNAR